MNQLALVLSQSAYALLLLAFLNLNRTWLHGLALLGSALAIAYCFLAEREPMFVPLAWHAAFAVVNGGSLLGGFFLEKWRGKKKVAGMKLDKLEEFLKKTSFAHFPKDDVVDFLRLAVEGAVEKGKTLMKHGEQATEFYCVLEGLATGVLNKEKQADFAPGHLLGENLLLGIKEVPYDVVATTDMRLLAWSMESVEHWTAQNPKNLSLLQALVGSQIVALHLEAERVRVLRERKEKTRAA